MTEHTPGPWFVYKAQRNAGILGVGDASGGSLLHLWRDGKEREANARLIAAAPEGLALANMIAENCTIETPQEWISAALGLISKAKGI